MNRIERVRTVEAAANALAELQIDQSQPVDPFRALEVLGLEVSFWPLDALLGAIVPGDPSGVMITTQRPPSVQRYTAAHEIGHWFLDRDHLSVDLPFDTQVEVLGMPSDERELRAQLFASYFLMPLPLVSQTARRYDVQRGSAITPLQAYAIGRDMQVSYAAAVRQLENCHFLDATTRIRFLKEKPASLKKALAFGRKPTVAMRDVWTAAREDRLVDLEVRVGDDLAMSLPENRTTGYRWVRRAELPERPRTPRAAPAPFSDQGSCLRPTAPTIDATAEAGSGGDLQERGLGLLPAFDEFVQPERITGERSLVGAGGDRRLVLHAQLPGEWTESYVYAAPFAGAGSIEDELVIRLMVRALPEQEALERRLERVAAEVR